MRKITFTICSAFFLLASCNNNNSSPVTTAASKDSAVNAAPTETKTTDKQSAPAPDSAAANAWQQYMTPGPMHKWLEKTNGTWEGELSQLMDPAAAPVKSMATIVQSSVMGGRYVIGKFSGKSMGQSMQGMSTTGYDNAKKIFVSTWIDNMGTGIIKMTGTFDTTTRTLYLKGFETDPLTGKEKDIREEMTLIDNDSYTMVLFGTGPDGKEMKLMEGVYKRKK